MPISESHIIPCTYEQPLPDFQDGCNIRFPGSLAEHMIDRFTREGDCVLDPFTGLGTTFLVCERTGRIPYGVEADKKRFDWVSDRIITPAHLLNEDSFYIDELWAENKWPPMDFSITSPPFMPRHDDFNPLHNGDPQFDGYHNYLRRITEIYRHVCRAMKRDAYVVVEASNLLHNDYFSPLVWDLGRTLSEIMTLEGEVIYHWQNPEDHRYSFSQCLVFRNNVLS